MAWTHTDEHPLVKADYSKVIDSGPALHSSGNMSVLLKRELPLIPCGQWENASVEGASTDKY